MEGGRTRAGPSGRNLPVFADPSHIESRPSLLHMLSTVLPLHTGYHLVNVAQFEAELASFPPCEPKYHVFLPRRAVRQ